MRSFTKFTMRFTVLLTLLLAVSWILYYLILYLYLPKDKTTESLHAWITIVLTVLPILILVLLFSLLLIRKPKFTKLHRNLSIYLTFLFLLNFMISIYDSHNQIITTNAIVSDFGTNEKPGYVIVKTPEKTIKLTCKKDDYHKLSPNTSYTIQYITNDLFTQMTPVIIQIQSKVPA